MEVIRDEHLVAGSSQFRDGKLFHNIQTIGELKERVALIGSTAKRSLYGFQIAFRPPIGGLIAFKDNAPTPKRAWAIFVGTEC